MTNTTTPLAHPELKGTDRVTEPCGRCGGSGIYHGPTNASWENGSGVGARPYCFECHGAGTHSVLVSSVRAREARERKAAADRQAQADAFRARVDAYWTSERQAVRDAGTAAHIALREGDRLRLDLGYALDAMESELAEDGAERVTAALAAIAERDAAKRPAPEGRVDIEGTVLSRKLVESAYGSTYKVLVEGEGWKVWGTLPGALAGNRGDRIAFTATVERSADDEAFGFYKRPTKARLVAAAE